MPTLDELQAQIEFLKQQVDAITAPPDEYYTLQYSGEEVDKRLSDEGGGTVKTVAGVSPDPEGNVNLTAKDVGAAPEGYGLGYDVGLTPEQYGNDLNNIKVNCWYLSAAGTANAPPGINLSEYGHGITLFRNRNTGVQIHTWAGGYAVRTISGGVWQPWEYINPPMLFGKEYRTPERYNGKPVYSKLIDLGAGLGDGTFKLVSHGVASMRDIVSCVGSMSYSGGNNPISLPGISSDGTKTFYLGANYSNIVWGAKGTAYDAYYGKAQIKYTKLTD